MIEAKDVFFNDGRLCIHAGRTDAVLRGSEFNGERMSAMLCSEDGITDVSWSHMTVIDGKRCIIFNHNESLDELPLPASELCGSLRPMAFELVVRLAKVLEFVESTKPGSLEFAFGALPLGSIYFLPQSGKVLLLPSQVCKMVDAVSDDMFRKEDRQDWQNLTLRGEYAKLNWLCQLVYYSITGIKPYAAQDVRDNSYKAIPLSLYIGTPETDPVVRYIDNVISFDVTRRDGVRKAFPTFAESFAKAADGKTPADYQMVQSEELSKYIEKNSRKASFNRYIRKKGSKIAILSSIIGIVLAVGIWYICHINKAPDTKDLEPVQIIEYYYNSMNEMDPEGMTTALANGVRSEDSDTVATCYAQLTMKSAYQSNSPVEIYTFNSWLESGQPSSIPSGDIIHGVTDLQIIEIDEWTYKATCLLWTNTNDTGLDEETGEYMTESTYTTLSIYRQECVFTFKMAKRGWYLISGIDVKNELMETRRIDYIEQSDEEWSSNMSISAMMSFF